jgi:probable O-glycosylation ligase (exosortase A-associated)
VRDLAFVIAWVVLVPLAMQGAQLGVLLWTWTSLLAPNDVLYGIGSVVPFSKVSAGLTLFLLLIGRGGGIKVAWNSTNGLIIGLALVGLVSQAFCLSMDTASGWDLCQKFLKILLLPLVIIAVMRDRVRLHALMFAVCLGLSFTGVAEGGKLILAGTAHKVVGSSSTGDNNQIALDVLLIMPLLYYLGSTVALRWVRISCFAANVMCGLCIISTSSRAGFVGLCLLGLGLAVISKRKKSVLVLVLLMGGVGAQVVGSAWVQRMDSIKTVESDDSFLGRIGAWKLSTAVALERPLFGGGFHAIQLPDVWIARRDTAANLPFFVEAPPLPYPRAAHSIYFEMLGDLGFVGLSFFVGLFVVALHNASVVRTIVRRSGRLDLEWASEMAGALRISVVLFLIVGASLSACYYDIEYILAAMLAALRCIIEQTLAEGATARRSRERGRLSRAEVVAGRRPEPVARLV